MDLLGLEVLVLDCQSSGASPTHGHLMELGWCQTRAGDDAPPRVSSRLVALPEGAFIPRAVSEITGLTRADFADAVEPAAVWRELAGALAGAPSASSCGAASPTVIHYASFEQAWLSHLAADHGPLPRALDVACTHAIARRAFPDLPRRSLRALAGYYGFAPELVRRSAGHVAATAHVWRHLVRDLAAQGVATWAELSAFLAEKAPRSKNGRRGFPMDRDKRLGLPDKPGIYQMLRTSGDVLYVGKATSLKRRVNSYFTRRPAKRRGSSERALEMLSQARDIAVTVTETAVEAALLETDLIKQHRPPYNVQLTSDARDAWFAGRDLQGAATRPDDEHRVGPLPSRYALFGYSALREVFAAQGGRRERLARALAMPAALGPEPEVFAAGCELFAARHGLKRRDHAALMTLSKRLATLQRRGELEEGEPREDNTWDPERVARHLERVVLAAGQLVRRARWLCLLSQATVAWQEPDHPLRRMLVVHRAAIVERAYLAPDSPAPIPPDSHLGLRERQAIFDIAAYDRLRVLSTELKRLGAEGCDVDVRLGERVLLSGERLDRLLWVI
jgi:DNA polymerase-3 subunit epsilon